MRRWIAEGQAGAQTPGPVRGAEVGTAALPQRRGRPIVGSMLRELGSPAMPQSHLILTKEWLTLGQQSAPHVPLPGHPWVLVREVGSDRVLTKAAVTLLESTEPGWASSILSQPGKS